MKEAILLLTDSTKKVSCHYLVDLNGKIFNLVDLKNRAWHAGESQWKNYKDLNSHSIGIEVVYPGEKSNSELLTKANKSNDKLNYIFKKKYKIKNDRILGHSDIAPLRKIDPGKFFPWEQLHKFSLGLWVKTRNEQEELNKKQYSKLLKNLKKLVIDIYQQNQ